MKNRYAYLLLVGFLAVSAGASFLAGDVAVDIFALLGWLSGDATEAAAFNKILFEQIRGPRIAMRGPRICSNRILLNAAASVASPDSQPSKAKISTATSPAKNEAPALTAKKPTSSK